MGLDAVLGPSQSELAGQRPRAGAWVVKVVIPASYVVSGSVVLVEWGCGAVIIGSPQQLPLLSFAVPQLAHHNTLLRVAMAQRAQHARSRIGCHPPPFPAAGDAPAGLLVAGTNDVHPGNRQTARPRDVLPVAVEPGSSPSRSHRLTPALPHKVIAETHERQSGAAPETSRVRRRSDEAALRPVGHSKPRHRRPAHRPMP
jgi:hypothetical protein